MIGIAFGVDSSYAVYVGFLLHMITGVIIGIVYSTLSENIKKLHITSVYKGLGTGILTGVVVWAILFLPLNYGIMQPNITQYGKYIKSYIFRIFDGATTA